jgi:hypothetical protein
VRNPKVKLTATAQVGLPTDTFAHLNDVLDCISWRQDRRHWECAKDDLLVELKQFKLHNASMEQKAVYTWLESMMELIPGIVEYVIFYEDN